MLIDLETYPWPEQGQRIAAMLRAAELEIILPRYATILDPEEAQAELARQVAMVIAKEKAAAPVATAAIPLATKPVAQIPWKQLPPGPHLTGKQSTGANARRSAERFLAWLLDHGHTGHHSSSEMTAFYRAYRAENPSETTKENILREHLGQLQPWVSKVQSYKRVKGQRVRPVVWEIGTAEPMRRAA